MTAIILMGLFSVVLIFISAFCVWYDRKKKEIAKIVKAAQDDVSELIIDKTKLRERVIELENHVNDTFSVSVRNDITKVNCIFDKLEMVIIMAGIFQLIKHSGNIDDKEAYIKLYKKAQENVEKMEEPDGD